MILKCKKCKYKTIKHKGKEFRIYIWENKPVKDFIDNMSKGFRLAEFQEFNELINDEVEFEDYRFYFVKHFNKLQWDTDLGICGLYRSGSGSWYADWNYLDYSSADVRVVVVRNGK